MIGPERRPAIAAPIPVPSGLLTAEEFGRRLTWELQRSTWLARPLTVASVDIIDPEFRSHDGISTPFRLAEATQVMQASLREQDALTCLRESHFVAAIPDMRKPDAEELVAFIRDACVRRAAAAGQALKVEIGVATFPEDGTSETEMLRAACGGISILL